MMSSSYLPDSFGGYVLEMTTYILNMVPSKSVPLHPQNYGLGANLV